MARRINLRRLKPGDVLLYRGSAWISRLIRFLDKSKVSHAGLYIGNGMVSEAIMVPGLCNKPIEDSTNDCEWVRARRLRGRVSMAPVLRRAEQYVERGNFYAYFELVLAAAVCLRVRIPWEIPGMRSTIHTVLNKADEMLHNIIGEDKRSMICSEFVYRCYDEALHGSEDPYQLAIASQTETRRPIISAFRRARGQYAGRAPSAVPQPPPGTLLEKLAQGNRLLASEERVRANAAELNQDLDSQLEQLFENIESNGSGDSLGGDNQEEMDEAITHAAARFGQSLIQAVPEKEVDNQPILLGNRVFSAADPTDRLVAIVAKLVTPGDLYETKSLVHIGPIW